MEVLRQRQEDDHAGRQDGATPATDALFTERETDGDEPATNVTSNVFRNSIEKIDFSSFSRL